MNEFQELIDGNETAMVIGGIVGLLLTLIPYFFFLRTHFIALNRVAPEHREMEPNQVWLNFIPAFTLYWRFVTVKRISRSLSNELEARGLQGDTASLQNNGIAACTFSLVRYIPVIGGILGLVMFVIWIIYWSKLHKHSKMIIGEAHLSGSDELLDQGV